MNYVGDLAGGLVGLTGFGGLLAFRWAVHLLTDAWTIHAVPLFRPLTSGRVRLPPWLATGSMMDAAVLVITFVLLAAYATWPYLAPSARTF